LFHLLCRGRGRCWLAGTGTSEYPCAQSEAPKRLLECLILPELVLSNGRKRSLGCSKSSKTALKGALNKLVLHPHSRLVDLCLGLTLCSGVLLAYAGKVLPDLILGLLDVLIEARLLWAGQLSRTRCIDVFIREAGRILSKACESCLPRHLLVRFTGRHGKSCCTKSEGQGVVLELADDAINEGHPLPSFLRLLWALWRLWTERLHW